MSKFCEIEDCDNEADYVTIKGEGLFCEKCYKELLDSGAFKSHNSFKLIRRNED